MSEFSTMMKVIGQFGFSVMGGSAHLTSNRTDGVKEQAPKMLATLIDIKSFAQLKGKKEVDQWFRAQKKLLIRSIVGGVGAGGYRPPSGSVKPQKHSECLALMSSIFL